MGPLGLGFGVFLDILDVWDILTDILKSDEVPVEEKVDYLRRFGSVLGRIP